MASVRKRIMTAVVAAILLGGVVHSTAADTEENKATFLRVLDEAWSGGQYAVIDEVVTADFVYHEPALGDIPGPEGFKQTIMGYRMAYPDLKFTSEEMIAEDDLVAMRWTARGTHQGELMGIPATGLATTTVGINIARFDAEGKMVEQWSNWDVLGLMQQLGVVEPARPGPEWYLWDADSDITGAAGDPQENKLLVLRVKQQFWAGRDIAGLDETHHPNAIGHDNSIPGERTYESYKQACIEYLTVFPDLDFTVDSLFAEGDKVVERWTGMGTQQGELMGIPASGKYVTFTGMTIYRIADGKIAETWWSYDVMGLIQQLTAPPEWTPEGTWIVTVPSPTGSYTMIHAMYPLDASGTRYGGVLWEVNPDPTTFGMFPDLTGGGHFWATESVRIAPNTYETGMVTYGTKSGDGLMEQVGSIGIATSTWMVTGPDTNEGQATLATYLIGQDVDGDGLPDEGQEPTVCVPYTFTSKRVKIMPACVPTEMSQEATQ